MFRVVRFYVIPPICANMRKDPSDATPSGSHQTFSRGDGRSAHAAVTPSGSPPALSRGDGRSAHAAETPLRSPLAFFTRGWPLLLIYYSEFCWQKLAKGHAHFFFEILTSKYPVLGQKRGVFGQNFRFFCEFCIRLEE